jgi:two-component system CheB/CheR fusion protein
MTQKQTDSTSLVESTEKADSAHYIIGIGASAGGLEAIHDLFDYMPQNTGFSFIVIQHLSPDYKSLMAELLSKHTQMEVCEAEDGMTVEPNCIYVIPSKKLMTVWKGRLHLVEKLKSKFPNNAIDVFFDSLAQECKEKAIAVILSGTGSDGSKGAREIKKYGGIVVVQDPLTAGFDGMPNSAVDTGCADLILPPEIIGEELINYLHDAPLLQSFNQLNQGDETSLQDILKALYQVTSRDFSHYKRPTLLRRLAKRMSEVGMNAIKDYKQFLQANDEEAKTLSKEFLINVTKFFRDSEAFEILRTEVIPVIVENKKNLGSTKVWVVACSSGEEAYSVAMLFLDFMEQNHISSSQFKVFATDIDSDALEMASRAIYPHTIARDVPEKYLNRYFVRDGTFYKVSPELRKHVVFAAHDVLKDPPFSHLDLVTCRNMFIYLNPMLQQQILRKFHFALNQDGYLMMGPSENVDILKDYMAEINRKWKIFRCVVRAKVIENNSVMMPLERNKIFMTGRNAPKTIANSLAEIFKDTLLESAKIAAIFIDREFNVKQAIGIYKKFLRFPDESFNFNLLKLVGGDLAVALGVAVRKAINQNEKVVMNRVLIHGDDLSSQVSITVKPYLLQKEYQSPFLCIILEEEVEFETKVSKVVADYSQASAERLFELERELKDTRENLQAVIEEMEASNEELQSSAEEMISTNEELQSTNEELQSLNEELHTVSGEHQLKIKQLNELNDDLNNYFNNSTIGQILVDQKMIIRKFSPAATKMINMISSDVGRSIAHISNNIKELDFIEEVKKVLRTGTPLEKEITIDGYYYLMRISSYIKRDHASDGAVISFTNITESKQLSSIINGVFGSSTNGITALKAIRDNDGIIQEFEFLAANKAVEKLYGMSQTQIIGKQIHEVLQEGSRAVLQVYKDVTVSGNDFTFEFHDQKNDRWYSLNVAKMMDGVVCTQTDITDSKKSANIIAENFEALQETSEQLKNSNMQLERSNLDLLQFASVASHDLKEPLRKVQAFGNILKNKISNKLDPDEMNYFDRMINASGRMQRLIEDVLSLSKLSDNGIPKQQVNLNQIIKNISDDLEIIMNEKNASIETVNLPEIKTVPWQAQQLFQNLIANSLKFCKPGHRCRIKISSKPITREVEQLLKIQADKFVCISVKDDGIGFEEEYSEKIFGLFQRLHGRKYEGTGIGLAIAKKIVENHGGLIRACGKLGEGAEFEIYLPN